jgi:hypothetical protein
LQIFGLSPAVRCCHYLAADLDFPGYIAKSCGRDAYSLLITRLSLPKSFSKRIQLILLATYTNKSVPLSSSTDLFGENHQHYRRNGLMPRIDLASP